MLEKINRGSLTLIEFFFRLQQIFLIFSQTLRVRGSDLDWNRRLPDSACTAAVFRILEEKKIENQISDFLSTVEQVYQTFYNCKLQTYGALPYLTMHVMWMIA